jgi:DNA end-binding protein Ku
MARTFWHGTLSFGLVEMPVGLRPAVDADELGFTLLDRRDFSPVGNKRYNKSTGREVPWEQIVRGFEYEPHEYVVLTEDEIKNAHPEATETIQILEFVNEAELDPILFDTPYYIEPERKHSRAYMLLHKALGDTGRIGIARLVLRTRGRVAAVMAHGPAMTLVLLRYAYEVKEAAEAAPPRARGAAAVSKAELSMAEKLIDGMTAKWEPEKYRDDYRDEVMALVRHKVKAGKTHEIVEAERKPAKRVTGGDVVDLMPLLKQSLAPPARARTSPGRGRKRPAAGRRHTAS